VLTATFHLPGILGLAAGDGAAWVTTGNAVLRIDARTDHARQILSGPGASLTGVAFGAGSLWVEGAAGLLRVDPVTGKVLARIGVHAWRLCFGDGALWALGTTTRGQVLVRVDPRTNAVRDYPLPAGKTWGLAVGEGGVWVSVVALPPPPGLLRVDPATGRVVAPIRGNHLFGQVAAGDGAVWASDGWVVSRADPRTGRVTATTSLVPPGSGASPVLTGSGLLAAAPGVVWVTRAAGAGPARVWRLGPRTGRLLGPGLPVGRQAQAVAASGATLWVVTAQGLARVDLVTCGHGRCPRAAPPGSLPQAPAPVWLYSLQMVSAAGGWALAWTRNPASPLPAALIPLHTTDGGRTWTVVAPAQARPLLVPQRSSAVLEAESASRAWLAVTLAAPAAGSGGTRPGLTEVFGTSNGGRTWTGSAPFRSPGTPRWLAFSDRTHGWLLQDLGAAMENDPVRVYRTSDGGRHWVLAAASPLLGRPGTGRGALASACDKTGIGFATPADGWLAGDCFPLADALLVSHDGGVIWAAQPLPLPSDACSPDVCMVVPPQFFGSTGFLTIGHGGGAPYLLVSHDAGVTWRRVALPQAAGPAGSVRFFGPRQGLLIPAVSQGVPAEVFYQTSDGGQTWAPAHQGLRFQPGMVVDFASPAAGFAWNPETSGAPPIYATTNGGRTWTWYLPRLVRSPR
jgi:photosystem II stability/assembly factor-like uncharacterized protein